MLGYGNYSGGFGGYNMGPYSGKYKYFCGLFVMINIQVLFIVDLKLLSKCGFQFPFQCSTLCSS